MTSSSCLRQRVRPAEDEPTKGYVSVRLIHVFFSIIGIKRINRRLPAVVFAAELCGYSLHFVAQLIHLFSSSWRSLFRQGKPVFSARTSANLNQKASASEPFAR